MACPVRQDSEVECDSQASHPLVAVCDRVVPRPQRHQPVGVGPVVQAREGVPAALGQAAEPELAAVEGQQRAVRQDGEP